ncbi:hypothetical protein VC83_01024 [Pseudogymnoascus destructans]|uniref:Uncharacterized protein n=1 Tax=Pseudogymnoascus destructans TaxID=655981 RepID=A0A177AMX0_9PEZI|nr:uncharacterized protein VC83_01024 [Pseudogymnoascus destructans]OAF62514.1 hypothetical protein VC83_01024 [Pseudogymnoascus destructans]
MPTPPPPPEKGHKPKLPTGSNKQVCPGSSHPNSSSGRSCTITPYPTTRGLTYCTTHQTICLLCPTHPRHLITQNCKSCVWRASAEKRAAEKAEREARAAAREAEREAALEAAEQQRAAAREAAGARSAVRTAGRREAPRAVRN